MFNLSDCNEIFRGYTTMIELYNVLKFIIMLFFIQKILTFNLGVAFLKSVSICFGYVELHNFHGNLLCDCKEWGCTYIYTHISATAYPRILNLVPNPSLDISSSSSSSSS